MPNTKELAVDEILSDSSYLPKSGVSLNARRALLTLTKSAVDAIWAVVTCKNKIYEEPTHIFIVSRFTDDGELLTAHTNKQSAHNQLGHFLVDGFDSNHSEELRVQILKEWMNQRYDRAVAMFNHGLTPDDVESDDDEASLPTCLLRFDVEQVASNTDAPDLSGYDLQ